MYRTILLFFLAVLTLNYWLWRLTSTLNWATWDSTLASLMFFLLESLLILRQLINYGLALGEPFRPSFQKTTAMGSPDWSVDIFIPTLDEPAFLLQRTIAGCQGIHYKAKRIWILDDGDRPEITTLAAQTGCSYLARGTRQGGKAGNLNYALQSQADFVAVFDADFIPVPHFLDLCLTHIS
jgi:cellulose synthase (UDP-forming)